MSDELKKYLADMLKTIAEIEAFVGEIVGTSHNVFGIQTGVAIMFLVKIGEK